MVFVNDMTRLAEVKKNSVINLFKIVLPSFIWAMMVIAIIYSKVDHFLLILSITFVAGTISLLIGSYLAMKRKLEEFHSYKIMIEDNYINIKSNSYSQKINKNEISEITKDKYGIITIHFKNKHLAISKYISELIQLESELRDIKVIYEKKGHVDYFGYLSLLFFCFLFLIRFVPDYRLYLIISSGFIITTFVSTVNLINSPIKKSRMIFPIAINFVLMIFVAKYLLQFLMKVLLR